MPTNFFSLPLNLRESIYEYVWYDISSVHIVDKESLGQGEVTCRFPEEVEERYPPPADEDEGDDDEGAGDGSGEDDGEWEDNGDDGSDLSDLVEELNADNNDDDDDDDDDGEDISPEEEDDDNDLPSLENEDETGHQHGYKVSSSQPLPIISLLLVSRQIHSEALPIFYATRTFTLDISGPALMTFLRTLPARARESITSITLTSAVFAFTSSSSKLSKKVWVGETKSPISTTGPSPIKMITPLGGFLATNLPALEILSFYFPFGGGSETYPPQAPLELLMLLWHRRITLLNFVFLGPHVAKTLKDCSGSDECYEILMGDWGEDAELNIGEHLFELENPAPEGEYSEEFREKCGVYFARRDEFAKKVDEGDEGLIWEWGDREGVEMGMDGNVQAVVGMWMTGEGEEEGEEA